MRVVVNPYGASNSAKELAKYLEIKRLKVNGSKFRGKNTDVAINWGLGKGNVGSARQINKLENVQLASNKLHTLRKLEQEGVSIPLYRTHHSGCNMNTKYVARTKLHGHSGDGIEIFTITDSQQDIPNAPLYVEYIPKVAEYRAIVVGDEVVDFKKKKKRASPRDDNGEVIEAERLVHDEHVWNLDGGYVFARNGFDVPTTANQLSIDATKALGLDFGAVDIIEDSEGKLYVLEINTAFGLEGTTIELVGNAMRRLI